MSPEVAQDEANATLAYTLATECVAYAFHRITSFGRAQKFPEAASRKIALSNSASAKSRFSRAFFAPTL